jgi:hypothetical protein
MALPFLSTYWVQALGQELSITAELSIKSKRPISTGGGATPVNVAGPGVVEGGVAPIFSLRGRQVFGSLIIRPRGLILDTEGVLHHGSSQWRSNANHGKVIVSEGAPGRLFKCNFVPPRGVVDRVN